MTQTSKVLIFPCGTEMANEIIKSLEYNKYFKMTFASSEKMSYCNYRGHKIHDLPYVGAPDFTNTLEQLIKNENIDFIIGAHDDVVYKLSEIELQINAKVVGQSKSVNEIVRFKDATYKYFHNLLPIPKQIKHPPSQNDFPVFVKPKRGQGSQDAHKLDDMSDYEAFFIKRDQNDFVVSELLPGDEYTIDCFSENGEVLYCGGRTREKTTRGISVQSALVEDENLKNQFEKHARIISAQLKLHGLWFFQLKHDKDHNLKLLEVGPRVSGTMMLNRVRGVNFVEMALYQKMGFPVEALPNHFQISLVRALVPRYKHNISYENLYIDFDDTLFLDEKSIHTNLMKLIFQAKNEDKRVILITKNKKNNLSSTLHKYGIANIFDEIIHLKDNDNKADHIKENAVLIDDSFNERKQAISRGIVALGVDNFDILLKN